MPTYSASPRGSGGVARGATYSATPRSSSGGGAPRTTTAAPRGSVLSGNSGAAYLANLKKSADAHVGPGPLFTPVNALLKASLTINRGIGKAIEDPSSILDYSAIDAYRDKNPTSIGQALAKRGVLPKSGVLGEISQFAADVVLDPTSWVTGGAGAASHAASDVGSRALIAAAKSAGKRGERMTIADVAAASAAREKALAAAPRAVSVGFRVPLTRGKVIPLAESQRLASAGHKVASAIGNTRTGENLREIFLPAGAGSKAAHRIGSDARRYGSAEKRLISHQALRFQTDTARAAKQAGMSLDDAYRALTRSIDQPAKYTVPKALEGARAEAVAQLGSLRSLEDAAGIDRGLVENYVPHLPANNTARRDYERLFPQDAGRDFFFQKERTLPNLDAWEQAGIKPEYNLARLIEARGHASVDARVLKAFDDAVGDIGATSAEVNRVKEIMRPSITGNTYIRDATSFINQVGSSWKGLALLSPGYFSRNAQSDLLSAYWAGARNPVSFLQAGRLLKGNLKSIKLGGQTFTRDEFLNLAEGAGAIRIGQAGSEIRGELAHEGGVKAKARGLKPSMPGYGRVARFSQNANEAREDFTRLGLFIERMKAGDDALQAGKVTRDFLYDYGDTGRFVKAARKFWLPFITFTSKAIPMVGRIAVTRPGTIANLAKTTSLLDQLSGNPDLSLLSNYQASSFGVPVPSFIRNLIGAPKGQALLLNPSGLFAYGALDSADPSDPVGSVMSFVSPFVSAPIEAKSGYSFYFGDESSKRTKAPAVINALHNIGVPIPGYGMKRVSYPPGSPSVPGYSTGLDTLLRVLPIFSQTAPLIPGGGNESTRLPYLKYFGGLPVSPYDEARAAYWASKKR